MGRRPDVSDQPPANSTAKSAPQVMPPDAQIRQLVFSNTARQVLYAVAELGISDHLVDGPRSADEVARITGSHAPSLYRLMRTAAGLGFFTEDAEHRFSVSPLGAALQSDAPGRSRALVRCFGSPFYQHIWSEFLHAVQTGESAIGKAYGRPIFDALKSRPKESALFNEAMSALAAEEPPAVSAAYDFSQFKVLVDVGGGTGNLLATILLSNPGPQGVLFDLPQVAAQARRQIEMRGLSQRCSVVEGSFFDAIPAGGDSYMLSHVVHDWSDADCLKILANCRKVIPPGGRLLLVEHVIPAGNDFSPAKLMDMSMLAMTSGGRERTEKEYAALLAIAGFKLTRIAPTSSPVNVIEAIPA
jgi:SAM-dependent methyltransferase